MSLTKNRQIVFFCFLALLVFLAPACGSGPAPTDMTKKDQPTVEAETAEPKSAPKTTNSFKPRAVKAKLTASGASFPDPIYQKWIESYKGVAPDVAINYQPVGSGQGRKNFFGGSTDFGGTDKYASDEELETFGKDVFHIPTVLGAVVVTYNLPDLEKIQFSGETLANIFLGKITKWNASAIAKENPGVELPDEAITVVHRSDGSGTTSIFTNYLSSVSKDWQTKVGTGDSVEWPVGIGGEKNPGVAQAIKQTEGAIGYVELIYATANKLPTPAIKNAAGEYVEPSLASTSAAAEGFLKTMPADLRVNIINPPEGEKVYPIAGFTWILVTKEQTDKTKATALTDFLYWSLTEGTKDAEALGYAPLPETVREKALEKLTQIEVAGKPAFKLPK